MIWKNNEEKRDFLDKKEKHNITVSGSVMKDDKTNKTNKTDKTDKTDDEISISLFSSTSNPLINHINHINKEAMTHFEQEMKSVTCRQPQGLRVSLFPHQLVAIDKIEQREAEKVICHSHYSIESSVGIFSDMTGCGKTLSMLSVCLRDRMEWNLQQDHVHSSILSVYGHGCLIKKSLVRLKRIPANLVVANALILKQWIEEIQKTNLRFQSITSKRKLDEVDPLSHDIILVVPHCYNPLVERFPNYAWKRFIFDEPTHTKISSMRPIVAGFIWFMTATPDLLLYQYRTASNFMSSIFSSYLDYNLYKHLIVKNDDAFIQLSFQLPPIHHVYHSCYQPIVQIIRDMINESIIEMISAGNIEGAVDALGGNSTSNIIDLIRQEKEQQIQECQEKMDRFTRFQDQMRVDKWTRRKHVLEHDKQELMKRFQSVLSSNTCHICYEQNQKPILLTCCQNLFCGECVFRWLTEKSSCPLCRRAITPHHLIYIQQKEEDKMNYGNDLLVQEDHIVDDNKMNQLSRPESCLKTKWETILHILFSRPKDQMRCLLFSNFNETFQPIPQLLQEHDITYHAVHGRSEQRYRQIEDFKQGHIQVLFLNSLQHGVGMNLQECTDIILFHPMNEEMETQLIGRAYRIGRTQELSVHHLV